MIGSLSVGGSMVVLTWVATGAMFSYVKVNLHNIPSLNKNYIFHLNRSVWLECAETQGTCSPAGW